MIYHLYILSCRYRCHTAVLMFSSFSLSSADVSVFSRKHPKTLDYKEEEAKAAATSLQAFINYQHLYEHWWRSSTRITNGSAADSSPADELKDKVMNGGISESEESVCPATRRCDKLDFDASLLLSERHAACQAVQRSVREVQERLAAMVVQHGRAQEEKPDSAEKETDGPAQISTTTESPDSQASAGRR